MAGNILVEPCDVRALRVALALVNDARDCRYPAPKDALGLVPGGWDAVAVNLDRMAEDGASPNDDPPGSTLDDLHNDHAALTVLLRLAELGAAECATDAEWTARMGENFMHETVADECDQENAAAIAGLYGNGAGGFEPEALVAWVKGRLEETANSIDGWRERAKGVL